MIDFIKTNFYIYLYIKYQHIIFQINFWKSKKLLIVIKKIKQNKNKIKITNNKIK